MDELHIGYVVKRFPRVSETFIAQEILELERQGSAVHVLALHPNDAPAQHAWLQRLRAEVIQTSLSFTEAWSILADWHGKPGRRKGVGRALTSALEVPRDRGRRYLAEAVAVSQLCEQRGISHLHAHFADHPAIVAWLAHQLTGIGFSFTAHAKDIWANPATPLQWRRLVGDCRFAVAVSEASRDRIATLVGAALAPRVRRLFNGVDLELLAPPAADRQAGRPPTLLCVARHVEKKGIDVLVDACAALAAGGVEFRLILIGDGPLREGLQQRVYAHGLSDRVEFCGSTGHEAVVRAMRDADVFVLPCRVAADGDRDTLPTVLLEAMSSGLPCVSTPVGGVAEIIQDDVTGLLVRPDTALEMAAAIERLLADPAAAIRMGRAGRARAEQLFDRRSNVACLYRWLQESVRPPRQEAARIMGSCRS